MGMATQTPNGLMVAVIRDAQNRDLWNIATEVSRLAEAARNGKASREELSGSTFTISSLGPMGGITSTPVINRPEVGIVAVNKVRETPVVVDGELEIRKMMNLSLSCDHRGALEDEVRRGQRDRGLQHDLHVCQTVAVNVREDGGLTARGFEADLPRLMAEGGAADEGESVVRPGDDDRVDTAEIDLVGALREIHDHIRHHLVAVGTLGISAAVTDRFEHEAVGAGAANEPIVPAAADQPVVATGAGEDIAARIADDRLAELVAG
jgi:hypothetical protein